MNKFLILFLLLSFSALSQTNLLLIGGGTRPVEAMRVFSQLSGGDSGKILIFPWASANLEGAENIRREILIHSNAKVEIVSPLPKFQKDVLRLRKSLQSATGVFFTGGDQNQLMETIQSLKLQDSFKAKFLSGTVFAGTSAGTAIMSESMLTGAGDLSVLDGSQIGRAAGLGLLPSHILVDQHFIVRSRFNRLAGVTLMTGEKGLAIDEGMAVLLSGNKAKVIGPTQVMTFTPLSSKKLSLDVFINNDIFDL